MVRKHTSHKTQGSHKVENKTLFNVRIYVDISQSVTACSLGTRLFSSFSDPWSRVIFCPISLCLCSQSLFDLFLVPGITTSPMTV